MLFLIMGASGSAESSALYGLKQQRPDIDWRDFDDALKHPGNTAERQLTTEYWLAIAAKNQSQGISTGIAGTTVLGEVLACPTASSIHEVHAILLDCGDLVRIYRIRARDGPTLPMPARTCSVGQLGCECTPATRSGGRTSFRHTARRQ